MTTGESSLRACLKSAHRVIIKLGTAVVTRASDGRLSLARLGALCEQVESLIAEGREVILVTSGAVGVGRQKLKYQRMMRSSFRDLQKPQTDLSGKPCAAIGQSGLMALYEALFNQVEVACSQLLVTERDFTNPEFCEQLSQTVDHLLEHRVVPIFNENDAISTRKAPYKDSTGIFWDNDSLAAHLAKELKADALVLLSDVDGLFTGPPSNPSSQLINTYIKEKHTELVTFGEKSRVGRGGMTAKVEAAISASEAGIPVVIASGFTPDGAIRALNGENVGTLFHKDAANWLLSRDKSSPKSVAVAARTASRALQALSSAERSAILMRLADALEAKEDEITDMNLIDVRAAENSGTSQALIQRLKLKPGRIHSLAEGIRTIAKMPEPIAEPLKRTELAENMELEKQTWPLGVLLVIFEARPDAMPQIAALSIRSGNGLLLKGGKEASHSNAIIHEVITSVLPPEVGPSLISLIKTRESITDLLQLDNVIDLVIPRGSNALVRSIKQNSKIPVLGHADGVCHIFVDKSANIDMAKRIVVDAKTDYPAACNAMETLLIHEALVPSGAAYSLMNALQSNGVKLYGGDIAADKFSLPRASELHLEYGGLECTVEIVPDVNAAISHIHTHGSAHTDCIITENNLTAQHFLNTVDSAVVMHNISTRFSDGFRFGLGAEVGISTSRIHARGPVGVEGLLTSRWILRGNGQIVNKDKDVVYTHKPLPLKLEENDLVNANGLHLHAS